MGLRPARHSEGTVFLAAATLVKLNRQRHSRVSLLTTNVLKLRAPWFQHYSDISTANKSVRRDK